MTIDRPTPSQLEEMKALWQEAFGDSREFVELFFRHGFSPERCRVVSDEALLGAVYWFDCSCDGSRFAYIYALAVKACARGRGVGTRLMDSVHRHLTALGYDGCLLSPAEKGLFDYYGRMGYRVCSYSREFSCAAGSPVVLERLTAPEYGRRRSTLLPPGGTEQTGATLEYLASYTELYGGDGVLLTAYRDGTRLVVGELLGDTAKAPGIVAALGCTGGSFRTPGGTEPNAMFRPLREGVTPPGYLGLTLG